MNDEAENLLARAGMLQEQGRHAEAITAYRQLLKLRPELTDSWYNLGYLLKAVGRYDAALTAYQQALTRGVAGAEEVHVNRAVIFTDHLRKDDAAEAELRAALKINPAYVPAWLNLGNLLEERGERGAAADCYQQIMPQAGAANGPFLDYQHEALARLLHLRAPQSVDDPLLLRARQAADGASRIDPTTRANLKYSLGRAYDGLGEYALAFAAFESANFLVRRAGPAYRRRRAEDDINALISAFPAAPEPTPSATARAEGDVPAPVFICGMFRSGSTLVEQVLSAHSRIIAGGELNILNRMTATALSPFPESISTLGAAQAAKLADDYRAELLRLFPKAHRETRYVSDKRPDNFLRIGLIKRLFPDAKIIHTVRNPLDTCLSIYFQHIDQRLAGYASNLDDIAHYFSQYRRLMSHWKTLFGEDLIDIEYDRLVREPQQAIEPVLTLLGLDWEARCLDFYRQKNTVKTASYWQVRRPLYVDSCGRWRHYGAQIGPLREALEKAGVDIDGR